MCGRELSCGIVVCKRLVATGDDLDIVARFVGAAQCLLHQELVFVHIISNSNRERLPADFAKAGTDF